MKTTVLGIALLSCVLSASAMDQAGLDSRVRALTARFEALQRQPDKAVPADVLSRAEGIILLERTKAGFVFAYQGGGGVALVKDRSGNWSPTALLRANEGSLGFQVGGEQVFYVMLLMNSNATRMLTDPSFEVGGEASGTAGSTRARAGGTKISGNEPVLLYDDHRGLYGGAAVKAGAISPDEEGNRIYYGKSVTMEDILFDNKVKPTEAATALAVTIRHYSKASK